MTKSDMSTIWFLSMLGFLGWSNIAEVRPAVSLLTCGALAVAFVTMGNSRVSVQDDFPKSPVWLTAW